MYNVWRTGEISSRFAGRDRPACMITFCESESPVASSPTTTKGVTPGGILGCSQHAFFAGLSVEQAARATEQSASRRNGRATDRIIEMCPPSRRAASIHQEIDGRPITPPTRRVSRLNRQGEGL